MQNSFYFPPLKGKPKIRLLNQFTLYHREVGESLDNKVYGFATTGNRVTVLLFTSLKYCTNGYVSSIFFTGKMGVLCGDMHTSSNP